MSQLKQIRIARGFSQDDLAALLRVHRTLIQHWEKGRRTPPFPRLQQLEQALTADARDLGFVAQQEVVTRVDT